MTEPTTYRVQSHKAISETMDGETIIIDLESGTYYSIDQNGTAVWQAVHAGMPIAAETAAVADFLRLLEDDGIIVRDVRAPIAPARSFSDATIEKYVDMQEMLLADPVHDVDTMGWPNLKKEA